VVLSESGREDLAEEAFREILNKEPEYVPALIGLAVTCARTGRIDDAIGLLEKAEKLSPENPAVDHYLTMIREME